MSRLAQCIEETKAELAHSSIPAPILGHVGDDNFHVTFSIDPNAPEEMVEVEVINKRLEVRTLAMNGTCTGEYGIGIGKQDYLSDELGEAVDRMRAVQAAIDPRGLLNPGKIFT